MIEYHNCPNCKEKMKMWLPFDINKPPVIEHECGHKVDFSFVYENRNLISLEDKELQQLKYLINKYKMI